MPLFVQCVPSFRVSIFPYSYIVFPKGDVSQSLSTFYFLLQSVLLFFLLVFLLSRDTSARASVLKTSPRSKSAFSKPKGKRYLRIFGRSRRVVFLGPTHHSYSTLLNWYRSIAGTTSQIRKARVVFTRVSKEIRFRFPFVFLRVMCGFENSYPFSTNQKPLRLPRTGIPALCAEYLPKFASSFDWHVDFS